MRYVKPNVAVTYDVWITRFMRAKLTYKLKRESLKTNDLAEEYKSLKFDSYHVENYCDHPARAVDSTQVETADRWLRLQPIVTH